MAGGTGLADLSALPVYSRELPGLSFRREASQLFAELPHQGGVYIPEELVPQIERCLDNGRALEGLLREAAERYAKALKYERTQKAKK